MQYISTRGGIAPVSFKQAVMMGLATDGGLLLPTSIPEISAETVDQWRKLSYPELATAVLGLFIDDIPPGDLRELVERSYSTFNHPEITPLVKQGDCYILELFHGPTLAFKDVALQFLGNVFEYLLKESGGRMNILGATSGDTGSAAIYGVRGKERINIFILHPHKRVSPIQELQMTSVTDANVFNLAVRGTFDDGQAIVKTIFNDLAFKDKHQLGAVNSINWARIVAQVVYYIHAALKVTASVGVDKVDFSVPTGNFGDIFAGFVARRMLPNQIRRLILATNENNLLTRFILNGDYSLGAVAQTSSPSMDIQVASNFERYLYYLNGEDADRTRRDMDRFAAGGSLQFDELAQERVRADFSSRSVNEAETIETIRDFYTLHGYVLDPHTAVGVKAGLAGREPGVPMICLATAHPAKFGAAVERAIGHEPELPPSLAGLANKETRCEVIPAEVGAVKAFVEQHAL
ncbi:MAG: threonine synthase [Desulfurivibrionaceae bacterium]|jgi:threonine synthase|nr:threonine synthase [Pseudomonadota bacterium]MBU4228678.1 threonine synthase [Pseudomonadota bacterium]MBU4408022.1 threonine synthase [Pseudomonadota bacterium]MCG2823163.1 threonine synthase [Desulfobulbaceae bacterium]MDP2757653.1 threonine synthase [Desulfurivibrionaceae bacterium]